MGKVGVRERKGGKYRRRWEGGQGEWPDRESGGGGTLEEGWK